MRKAKTRRISSWFIWMAILGMIAITAMVLNSPIAYGKEKAKALVNLNTASEKELKGLKGVGSATAKKIIAGRPYTSVDDLSKAGIPAKTIEAIKPFVTVGPAAIPSAGAETPVKVSPPPSAAAPEKEVEKAKAAAAEKTKPTVEKSKAGAEKSKSAVKLAPGQKININTATKEELDALPGVGPTKAQAIIDGRPYEKTEDVMKVKGIKQGTFNKMKDYITVK
jgi:competence protein ComEA